MKPYRLSAFALLVFTIVSGSVHARGPSQFNLGPTGLTGTPSKTTIKVTKVAEGSPADGKIKVNDEILGAG